MAGIRVIEAAGSQRPKRRIGVYVRVSTDSSDQQNSYASQISYYTAMIEKHPEWALVDIYADEGISGTSMEQRNEFQRLMRDARKGMLDEVFTKSISRFARNTRDCLTALRELNLLGVTVRFDKENMNTQTLTTELMVSVSSALAQEESISLSQNMRWSYQKRMQSGKFITCNAPFGYRLHGKGMVIHEDEAEIVRWIFDSYLAGMNTTELAEAVTATGFTTGEGNTVWSKSTISYMLQNEKYIGDSLNQKQITLEYFPFTRKRNKGQKPKYYAVGTHPAIIDRDTFDRVQELIRSRRPKSAGAYGEYTLSKKIICKNCGATFMRRTTTKGIAVWCCRTHDKDKDACSVGRISEAGIYAAFMEMAAKLRMNLNTVLSPALSQLQELSQREARTSRGMLEIVKEIGSIQEKSLLLNRLRERNMIPIDAFLQKNADMSARLAELKRQRRLQIEAGDESREMRKGLLELQHILQEAEIKGTFDAQLFERIVEKVIAESSKRIWFQVSGGLLLPSDIKEKMR